MPASTVNRFPCSTYRLQFHAGFTFRDATAIVPYLHALGISHVYASPYFAAAHGSTHGYDVISHSRLNPEIGTQEDYDAWVDALRDRGMSHILDTVPNHMGVATNENAWWNDVLAHGSASKYANYFDISWDGSARPAMRDKVLLPVLGTTYGEALDKHELNLVHENGQYAIAYYDRRFPVDPATIPAGHPQDVIAQHNKSPDKLDQLIRRQHFRLSSWRVASDEINYRRFFDINDLAALSMEREEVFEDSHRFLFELIRDGKVAGLRIDHPDGLYDPQQYFEQLQRKYAKQILNDEKRASEKPLYVVAEKILAVDEPFPETWPCHGTSGYDFLIMANSLFVDHSHAEAFTKIYDEWTGEPADFEELIYQKKKLILEISLAGELQMLARRLDALAQSDRRTQDFTLNGLFHALREVIACFPVYRSYVTSRGVSETDIRQTEIAVQRAIERNPKTDSSAFRFVGDVVLLRSVLGNREDVVHFAGKFQQVTAPTTAKGIEDTAFYSYHRLFSLNEVGGEPQRFGVSASDLHRYFADRQRRWPFAMSTLSTHDTKRSEDVRARINVLSEIPDEWREHVTRWREFNAPHVTDDSPAPDEQYLLYQALLGAWPLKLDDADRPQFVERIQAYMVKAMREAKLRTSWTAPNERHEKAVTDFVAAILDPTKSRAFLDDFQPFQRRISHFGMINSLSQTLLKFAAPGVPDTYQGTELWDYSLVDPDNRRPVDYALRNRLLFELKKFGSQSGRAAASADTLRSPEDGRIKLLVATAGAVFSSSRGLLLSQGDYIPLTPEGRAANHLFAFGRVGGAGSATLIVAPRFVSKLRLSPEGWPLGSATWGDTRIPLPPALASRTWRNAITGESISPGESVAVATLLANFPVGFWIVEIGIPIPMPGE